MSLELSNLKLYPNETLIAWMGDSKLQIALISLKLCYNWTLLKFGMTSCMEDEFTRNK